jgi:hypothetical protein
VRRGGLGISNRSIFGKTAIFFHNSRSDSDETTETEPLAGLQGESGFGSLERREDDRAACYAFRELHAKIGELTVSGGGHTG